MNVLTTDGKKYKIKLTKQSTLNPNKSKGHLYCRELLKKLWPSDNIFEEITISPGLVADFIIPLRKLIVECQGTQHYTFNKFFQGDLTGFNAQKNRDNLKQEWCTINGFILVALDNRDTNGWEQQLLNAFN